MTFKTEKYARTPFIVEAVQVTEENMADVTAWCGGEVRKTHVEKPYIKVDAYKPLHSRQSMAFAGDWVLMTDSGVKVYTNKAFEAAFEPYFEGTDELAVNRLEGIFKGPEGAVEPRKVDAAS